MPSGIEISELLYILPVFSVPASVSPHRSPPTLLLVPCFLASFPEIVVYVIQFPTVAVISLQLFKPP